MKLFTCPNCANILYFENTKCEKCEAVLGFDADSIAMIALSPQAPSSDNGEGAPDQTFAELGGTARWQYCANASHSACNWLLPAGSDEPLCFACRHNGTIPDLAVGENLARWRRVEAARHRLFYSILSLHLPTGRDDPDTRNDLIFDVLADDPAAGGPPVLTGHDGGRITLALAEADDAERERRRALLGEPYRTLLGHFRHEIGHYYWDMLVDHRPALEDFRALFGDERADYNAALQAYYASGAPPDWYASHVSAYACAHPWEDFAETFAHYLHIVDTLEMAVNFGVRLRPAIDSPERQELAATLTQASLKPGDFQDILHNWLPITFMANNLNRCMGSNDLYPFVLMPKTCEKLKFVHELICRCA